MQAALNLLIKGMAMGAANVVPGVSGGTIALITGIYQRLIDAIRHFDLDAVRLLLKGRWREAWAHVDGAFLVPLLAGVAIGIIALSRLVKWLLADYRIGTMAFFFGLILLSIWYVGRTVERWNAASIAALITGTVIAAGIAMIAPLGEDPSFLYVFVCGVIAICSMILPGLSGSFVLIILGNYALVIGAVSSFDFNVLIPMALGCVFGLVAFSHFLSWVFARFRDVTVALMTGFVLGSLAVIWPWKHTLTVMIPRDGAPPKEAVTGYEWYLPALSDSGNWMALAMIVAGMVAIWATERFAGNLSSDAG